MINITKSSRLIQHSRNQGRGLELLEIESWANKKANMYAPQSSKGQAYRDLIDFVSIRREKIHELIGYAVQEQELEAAA